MKTKKKQCDCEMFKMMGECEHTRKEKKKTKKYNVISIEILNYVLDGIYKRLDSIDDQLVALRDKDAEVIDLDKEVEKSRHMKDIINDSQRLVAYKYAEGVDDSEEFTEVELKCLRNSLVYTLQEPNSVHGNGVMNLLVKLNKMLKEKE